MKPSGSLSLRFTALTALSLLLAAALHAGPPLICHVFDIGDRKSLPWISHDWNLSGSESYDTSQLTFDTTAILEADDTVLVHMETLRRATLYARRDPAAAKRLFSAIITGTKLTRPEEAKNLNRRGLTYFDAGYLAEAYKQWLDDNNPAKNVDGYALVQEALRIRGSDPQMELA